MRAFVMRNRVKPSKFIPEWYIRLESTFVSNAIWDIWCENIMCNWNVQRFTKFLSKIGQSSQEKLTIWDVKNFGAVVFYVECTIRYINAIAAKSVHVTSYIIHIHTKFMVHLLYVEWFCSNTYLANMNWRPIPLPLYLLSTDKPIDDKYLSTPYRSNTSKFW